MFFSQYSFQLNFFPFCRKICITRKLTKKRAVSTSLHISKPHISLWMTMNLNFWLIIFFSPFQTYNHNHVWLSLMEMHNIVQIYHPDYANQLFRLSSSNGFDPWPKCSWRYQTNLVHCWGWQCNIHHRKLMVALQSQLPASNSVELYHPTVLVLPAFNPSSFLLCKSYSSLSSTKIRYQNFTGGMFLYSGNAILVSWWDGVRISMGQTQ